jgi:hypothetical protein
MLAGTRRHLLAATHERRSALSVLLSVSSPSPSDAVSRFHTTRRQGSTQGMSVRHTVRHGIVIIIHTFDSPP